jgi:hypothetical protein
LKSRITAVDPRRLQSRAGCSRHDSRELRAFERAPKANGAYVDRQAGNPDPRPGGRVAETQAGSTGEGPGAMNPWEFVADAAGASIYDRRGDLRVDPAELARLVLSLPIGVRHALARELLTQKDPAP